MIAPHHNGIHRQCQTAMETLVALVSVVLIVMKCHLFGELFLNMIKMDALLDMLGCLSEKYSTNKITRLICQFNLGQ